MPTDQRPRAWRLLVETHGLLFGLLADELDMPISWYDVLLHLSEVPGERMRMAGLARAVVVSKSGLTTIVDRLEEEGLVRREVPAGDRRSVDVVLTRKGRRRFEAAARVHRAGIDRVFCAQLTPDEGRVLAGLLERLKAANAPSTPEAASPRRPPSPRARPRR